MKTHFFLSLIISSIFLLSVSVFSQTTKKEVIQEAKTVFELHSSLTVFNVVGDSIILEDSLQLNNSITWKQRFGFKIQDVIFSLNTHDKSTTCTYSVDINCKYGKDCIISLLDTKVKREFKNTYMVMVCFYDKENVLKAIELLSKLQSYN